MDDDSPWTDQRSTSPSQPADPAARSASQPIPVKSSLAVRGARSSRRGPSQPVKLETVADDTDPLLGPLAASGTPDADVVPALPQKGPALASLPASRPAPVDEDGFMHSARAGAASEEQLDSPQRRTPPGVTVGAEEAARPLFNITVGDPHKVGDLTGSHMAYQVRTKTNSKQYRQAEFEVARRYKDFLWLYGQLHNNHAGVIVPPPPEKQAMGRYESEFVESRRAALERMLNKTASHMLLQHDGDLKLFLESDAFNVDVKNRERRDSDMPAETKGMFSGLNLSVGSGTKFIEHDDWFLERRVYLDNLDTQLKGLLKATDSAVSQRRNLSEASAELSVSLNSLSQVELSTKLSGPLASLSDLHLRIRDLYARQAQQDVLTLSTVIDEYVRLIGSIRRAFEGRQRSWHGWHNAESDLQKRHSALDKLARAGRSQQDRLTVLQADVADAERRAHQARLAFEDLGRGMRVELERFEREKVEDFRMGVETYLESAVEAQKELIELWETYLMHLDADEEEEDGGEGEEIGAGDPVNGDDVAPAPTAAPEMPPAGGTEWAEQAHPITDGNATATSTA